MAGKPKSEDELQNGASEAEAEKVTLFVTIGCKLPQGLHLDLHDSAGLLQARHTVNGNARFVGVDDPRPNRATEGGFSLTHGVPEEHAKEWFRRNADSDLVRNGLIFMSSGNRETAAMAKDAKDENTGFQPIPKEQLEKGAVRRDPRLREIKAELTHAPKEN